MNKHLMFWIKLLVTALFLGITYVQLKSEISAKELVESFKNIDMNWLVAATSIYFISLIFSAIQWAILLRKQSIEISNFKAIRLYFVGLFFSNFLIGNVGGDIKRVYDVTRDSKKLGASVTATLFDRIFGLYTLSFISVATGALFFINDFELGKFVFPCLMIFITLSLGFAGLFSMRIGQQIDKVFKVGSKLKLTDKYRSIRESFQLYRGASFLGPIFAFSFVIQILRIYTQVLMANSLGLELDLSYYFFLVPIIGIVTALPISVGGFGPRELVSKELMGAVGWSPLQAVIWQFIGVLINVFLGLIGAIEFVFGRKSIQSENKKEEMTTEG